MGPLTQHRIIAAKVNPTHFSNFPSFQFSIIPIFHPSTYADHF
jgi:hypothetical protein